LIVSGFFNYLRLVKHCSSTSGDCHTWAMN